MAQRYQTWSIDSETTFTKSESGAESNSAERNPNLIDEQFETDGKKRISL